MPRTNPRKPQKAPAPAPGGWISERTLAQLYSLPQLTLRTLLKRTGLPYREIRYQTTGGSHFWRTYWPAALHPSANPTSKPQPEPEQ